MSKIETYKSNKAIRSAKTRFASWAKKSLFVQTPAQTNPAQLGKFSKEESLGFDSQIFQEEFNAVVGAYKPLED